LASKPVVTVFQFGIKTDGDGLMICALKSLQRFFGLCLKTKWTTVYQLRHKID
jgi:hypothetical protein